jgi:hypothetical protein
MEIEGKYLDFNNLMPKILHFFLLKVLFC